MSLLRRWLLFSYKKEREKEPLIELLTNQNLYAESNNNHLFYLYTRTIFPKEDLFFEKLITLDVAPSAVVLETRMQNLSHVSIARPVDWRLTGSTP